MLIINATTSALCELGIPPVLVSIALFHDFVRQ
jgi:hypothetical protein